MWFLPLRSFPSIGLEQNRLNIKSQCINQQVKMLREAGGIVSHKAGVVSVGWNLWEAFSEK